jgi:hypothetical protein
MPRQRIAALGARPTILFILGPIFNAHFLKVTKIIQKSGMAQLFIAAESCQARTWGIGTQSEQRVTRDLSSAHKRILQYLNDRMVKTAFARDNMRRHSSVLSFFREID